VYDVRARTNSVVDPGARTWELTDLRVNLVRNPVRKAVHDRQTLSVLHFSLCRESPLGPGLQGHQLPTRQPAAGPARQVHSSADQSRILGAGPGPRRPDHSGLGADSGLPGSGLSRAATGAGVTGRPRTGPGLGEETGWPGRSGDPNLDLSLFFAAPESGDPAAGRRHSILQPDHSQPGLQPGG